MNVKMIRREQMAMSQSETSMTMSFEERKVAEIADVVAFICRHHSDCYENSLEFVFGRENKAGYTASGVSKHLYKRVNEKA